MQHNGKASAEVSLQPEELKSRVWIMTVQVRNIAKRVACTDDHTVALKYQRWAILNQQLMTS